MSAKKKRKPKRRKVRKPKPPKQLELTVLDGLLTYTYEDSYGITNRACLGYVRFSEPDAVEDPALGILKGVTKEQAETHNQTFSRKQIEFIQNEMSVDGGEEECLYLVQRDGRWQVETYMRELVSVDVDLAASQITFRCSDRTFVGTYRPSMPVFACRRTA